MEFYLQTADGQQIQITKDRFTIGRSKTNDIIAAADRVSRNHAELSIEEGGLYITDSGSSNGTRVNERMLERGVKTALNDGDIISLANVVNYSVVQKYSSSEGSATLPEKTSAESESRNINPAFAAAATQKPTSAPSGEAAKKSKFRPVLIALIILGILSIFIVPLARRSRVESLYQNGEYEKAYKLAYNDDHFNAQFRMRCLLSAYGDAISEGDEEAAKRILDTLENDKAFKSSPDKCSTFVRQYIPADLEPDSVLKLTKKLLKYGRNDLSANNLTDEIDQYGSMVGTGAAEWKELSRSEYERIGKAPAGKILLVGERHPFGNASVQCIAYDLMKYLPEKFYPERLEEVSYVILVHYDFVDEARYGDELVYLAYARQTIPGLVEYCNVNTYVMPGWKSVFSGTTCRGKPLPDTILSSEAKSYYTSGPITSPSIIAKDIYNQLNNYIG